MSDRCVPRLVEAYQSRLAELRFDPGPIDGQYGLAVAYAVQALQKFKDLPVTGVIGQAEVDALNLFTYPEPLVPGAEPNRTEVDIAWQTLTLYEGGQPRLLTTMSSGSGEHYCYETPRDNPTERVCEVANTPGGRSTYYLFRPGWDVGVLGGLYNPFYFNGGVVVHGYGSVPLGPASHGCVRIPMHIAEYFHALVHGGDPVYVIGGTPFQVLCREPLIPPAHPSRRRRRRPRRPRSDGSCTRFGSCHTTSPCAVTRPSTFAARRGEPWGGQRPAPSSDCPAR